MPANPLADAFKFCGLLLDIPPSQSRSMHHVVLPLTHIVCMATKRVWKFVRNSNLEKLDMSNRKRCSPRSTCSEYDETLTVYGGGYNRSFHRDFRTGT